MGYIADLIAAISGAKSTPSGKVEHNTSSQSLPLIHAAIQTLLAERGVPFCPDVTALQELTGTESKLAFLEGAGFFLYVEGEEGDYASADGLGYWNRQLTYSSADLSDFNLDIAPTNGQVPVWNAGEGKWKAGNATVSALNWLNITSKPAQISGIAATDLLVKLFAGANSTIGVAAMGTGNVILTPDGNYLADAGNSTIITANRIEGMIEVRDSVIITDMESFRTSTDDFIVRRCIIIGDTGPLDAYFASDELNDLVIIGSDGAPVFVKQANGTVTIDGGTGGTPNLSIGMPVAVGADANFNNNILVGGDAEVSGDTVLSSLEVQGGATVSGILTADGPIQFPVWTTLTRPASPTPGMAGFNTDGPFSMEYYNGSGWQSF